MRRVSVDLRRKNAYYGFPISASSSSRMRGDIGVRRERRCTYRRLTYFMIQMQDVMSKAMTDFREGSIVKGRILETRTSEVLVDVGYKSEGVIPWSEFEETDSLEVGDEVDVLLEGLENEEGMVVVSEEKADYRQNWNKIVTVFDGDGLT